MAATAAIHIWRLESSAGSELPGAGACDGATWEGAVPGLWRGAVLLPDFRRLRANRFALSAGIAKPRSTRQDHYRKTAPVGELPGLLDQGRSGIPRREWQQFRALGDLIGENTLVRLYFAPGGR